MNAVTLQFREETGHVWNAALGTNLPGDFIGCRCVWLYRHSGCECRCCPNLVLRLRRRICCSADLGAYRNQKGIAAWLELDRCVGDDTAFRSGNDCLAESGRSRPSKERGDYVVARLIEDVRW